MRFRVLIVLGLAFAFSLGCAARPADEAAERTATVYRDEYGIPHIYAESAEAGLYASGWLQAEDRLEQLLKNFLLGLGEYAAAHGAGENDEWVRSDLESLMWDHYGVAQRHYEQKLNPELRAHLAAFVQGIRDYMAAHPQEVPAWWGDRVVDVYMPVAFSRQFIWGWPAGQAASDLRRAGLSPSYDVDVRASNQIALAPSRTSFGAAALIIDPHLSWLGRQRYWEMRLHAGDIHISGFATAGFPYVNLGHNRHIGFAHTTGGPDTGDVYELALDPENPARYRWDGGWRELTSRSVELRVAGEAEPRRVTFWFSHHGPIVARAGNQAYAAALAYAAEIGYLESKYWFMLAEDYRGAIKALEVRQIMPQNVMVADTSGNIYYQRTGRVPIRPDGYDWSAPVDGTTSATEWQGIHPVEDLISLLNPPQGYMQNCNITPDVMLAGSPMQSTKYRDYLFNQPEWLTHQRGSNAVAQLEARATWSAEDFLALAVDTSCYQADRWQRELERADATVKDGGGQREADYREALRRILAWDQRADPASNGAALYWLWRHALVEVAGEDKVNELILQVNDYLEPFREAAIAGGTEPPAAGPGRVADRDLPWLVEALEHAVEQATTQHASRGGLDLTYGDLFRVGRTDATDDVSWPVGGGSHRLEGMATLRAVGFDPEREDGTRWGRGGQTSTEVVLLTDPIQSFTQPPIGQSDRPDSAHYRDQAEKLFSPGKLKPSWFWKEDLIGGGHVRSEERIVWPGPAEVASERAATAAGGGA
ncbi:MAG TPA: penicillin acylase family protein [Thermoanaerobaculia bacterium]|nr:penicillin acylase family protein [Thermoanaerobaculia bacterium]